MFELATWLWYRAVQFNLLKSGGIRISTRSKDQLRLHSFSFNMRTILLFVYVILHKLLYICVISFLLPFGSSIVLLTISYRMYIHG